MLQQNIDWGFATGVIRFLGPLAFWILERLGSSVLGFIVCWVLEFLGYWVLGFRPLAIPNKSLFAPTCTHAHT